MEEPKASGRGRTPLPGAEHRPRSVASGLCPPFPGRPMSRRAETILWYDYETTGIDPRVDRPLSFAACRTDLDLNEVEAPVEVHFRLAEDCIPSPEACLITGLDPDRPGTIPEIEGARRVLTALGEPRTCGAGYNSIRFDDEVTRFLLWRNLLPVYERESRNGSSRFDLLPVLRAACALRPDGIEWPVGEEGWPVFKLDVLAPANGIHHQAHDALADVRATIAMGQKLLAAQPDLFGYLSEARFRDTVRDRLRDFGSDPFVHTSGRFPAAVRSTSVVVYVADHPRFRGQILCLDLRHDPQVLLDHDVEQLRTLLFTPRDQRPEGAPRVGIKGIHPGRCPIIAPLSVLDPASQERIALEPSTWEKHRALVDAHRDELARKVQAVHDEGGTPAEDVDQALYDGFVEDDDAALCREVHAAADNPTSWRTLEREFRDDRLGELLFRLRARNHPESLGMTEHARWMDLRRQKALEPGRAALARCQELRAAGADTAILDACEAAIRRRVEPLGAAQA